MNNKNELKIEDLEKSLPSHMKKKNKSSRNASSKNEEKKNKSPDNSSRSGKSNSNFLNMPPAK